MATRAEQPFVGRQAEAALLARHHAAATDGSGRIVLITGEAGIGKTRIVEEVLGAAGTSRVAWGRCHEGGGAPAFWPWTEALRPVMEQRIRAHTDGARLVERFAALG